MGVYWYLLFGPKSTQRVPTSGVMDPPARYTWVRFRSAALEVPNLNCDRA